MDREAYNERVRKWYVPDDPAAPRYVMLMVGNTLSLACGHKVPQPPGFHWDDRVVCPTCIREE